MSRRLTIETITSVGAVPEGDNPAARIMLYKARPDRAKQEKDTRMDLSKLALTEEAEKLITAEIARLQSQIDALTAHNEEPEDVLKSADPKVKELFKKQQADIATLQKQAETQAAELAKERDDRRTVEVAKIVEQYSKLIGDDENAVPMLKAIPDSTLDWLTERFNHVSKIVEQSGLFKEAGSGASDDDPAGQIQALAIEKMGQNKDLTIAQARVLARTERPDLALAEREGA